MKHIKYIIGLVGVLVGWIFFERGKRKVAEAINENVETKEQIQTIEGQKLQNNADLKVEEERRKDASDKANDEKSKSVGDSDITDFFNKLK